MTIEDGAAITLYTIYDSPSDYRGQFVVRRWYILPNHNVIVEGRLFAASVTLESARAALPPGLVNIGREPEDDPVIAEVWM